MAGFGFEKTRQSQDAEVKESEVKHVINEAVTHFHFHLLSSTLLQDTTRISTTVRTLDVSKCQNAVIS